MHKPLSTRTLDEIDISILKGLYRFRYMTIDLISEINPNRHRSSWTKRLRILIAHGFVDRPPKQLWMIRKNEKAIYALDQNGADFLSAQFDFDFPRTVKWHEKNRRYRGQDPFSHALSTAFFMTELEKALKLTGASLTHQDELLGVDYVTGIGWPTQVITEFSVMTPNLKPDGIFSISKAGEDRSLNFCLEIDRGTMPIRSSNFQRSSILKKYLSYRDTHERGLLRDEFDFRNFRVLIVTTTRERADNMRSLWRDDFADMPKLCLFTSFEEIEEKGVLDAWSDAQGSQLFL